jgi:hypothetical protein
MLRANPGSIDAALKYPLVALLRDDLFIGDAEYLTRKASPKAYCNTVVSVPGKP